MRKQKTIRIELYKPWEVAFVYVSNELNYAGNYWDFYPGCHGIYNIGNFSTPYSYALCLRNKFSKQGYNVKIWTKSITEKECKRKM